MLAIELNKVVLLMTQYPTVVIKIESHTDSRANDQYNLELSDRRAKTTRDYIISQGIAPERIESAIGYGETQLLNNCSNGVPCTEAQHQMNRRSEFIITKM
ncbi:OmpA family protein [Flavobacterium sp. P21]|uniref:OmpA family protein n=1 Tax=Flavobacterium sp. P21 TaxID=3423948 RepID=UPI003D66F9B4